jgi:hypothetical protein
VFQVAGAIAAAAVLKIVAEGHPGFVLGGFASNGYGDLSPGHCNLLSCAVAVHLQNVDVMSEPFEQCACEPLGSEYGRPFVERQIGGDKC